MKTSNLTLAELNEEIEKLFVDFGYKVNFGVGETPANKINELTDLVETFPDGRPKRDLLTLLEQKTYRVF